MTLVVPDDVGARYDTALQRRRFCAPVGSRHGPISSASAKVEDAIAVAGRLALATTRAARLLERVGPSESPKLG